MNIHEKGLGAVALISGGEGVEHPVSREGAKYLLSLMKEAGFTVVSILIDRTGNWYIEDDLGGRRPTFPIRLDNRSGLLIEGDILPISAAFPLLHGDRGEDGSVQGALEVAGIPYVGAKIKTGSLCLDKINTKLVAENLGIPTVEWLSINRSSLWEEAIAAAEEKLGYPMFVKPSGLGSSVGAHPVGCREELLPALRDARRYDGPVLIEKMLEGIRELEVAFFESRSPDELILTEPGEVNAGGFYDYQEKYSDSSQAKVLTKADISPEISEKIHAYSDSLSREVGLRQLGRLDFFLSGDRIYFNEINTMPGFTPTSLYPRMLESAGVSPAELVSRLLCDAAGRLL